MKKLRLIFALGVLFSGITAFADDGAVVTHHSSKTVSVPENTRTSRPAYPDADSIPTAQVEREAKIALNQKGDPKPMIAVLKQYSRYYFNEGLEQALRENNKEANYYASLVAYNQYLLGNIAKDSLKDITFACKAYTAAVTLGIDTPEEKVYQDAFNALECSKQPK